MIPRENPIVERLCHMRCDVIFVSYDEPNGDQNFERLLEFAPDAKRVHGVKGVMNAHHKAAHLANSDYFFVVDGDNWILDGFRFDAPEAELSGKYLWFARNAVNGMDWGNGGIKLLNKANLLAVEDESLDYFVEMKGPPRIIQTAASETRFNTTPFLAWRCGFKECAKLAGGMFNAGVIEKVLEVWQTVGADKPNGIWCILGSRLGASFGKANRGSSSLEIINDMDWVKSEFEKCREAVVQREM